MAMFYFFFHNLNSKWKMEFVMSLKLFVIYFTTLESVREKKNNSFQHF